MFDKNSFYTLAEVFAILSGTWVVASGIYQATSSNAIIAMQNNVNTIFLLNNSQVNPFLLNVSGQLTTVVNQSQSLSLLFITLGMIFGVLSIVFAISGSIKKNK